MLKNFSVARSAFLFLSGTLLSRLFGLLRDLSMSFCFGAHPALAAFFVSYRLANLMRRLFGEGALSSGFIPQFETIRKTSPLASALFFRDLAFSLSLFLIGLILLIEGGFFIALNMGHLGEEARQLILLMMTILPGILFICQFGLSAAFLHCEKRFFLSGFAPVMFNVIWIGAVWILKNQDLSQAVVWLSFSIVVAFLVQLLVTLPPSFVFFKSHLSLQQFFRPQLFSRDIQALLKPLLLGLAGVGAVQVNSALDAVFARFAAPEGPAYLWYAIRIEQLPLALFGIALSSALLPALSKAICDGDSNRYLRLVRFGLTRSFSLILPCTFGLFVLGVAGVNMLYGRGHFTDTATLNTAICLWGYAMGLVPSVFVLLLAPAFYAKKDYRTPMRAALFSVILNIILNAFLVFILKLGAFSVAVSTSAAAFFNCG
ncbi:MAG: murein biosynthesis integral membrane protein MurJ [Anaerolineae bacterium]